MKAAHKQKDLLHQDMGGWPSKRVGGEQEQERGAEAKVQGSKGNFTNESLGLENNWVAEHLPGIGSIPSTA